MKALLVYPKLDPTYWGQEYTGPLTGKQAVLPPLGLMTVAALLPQEWDLKLVDLNVADLGDQDIQEADLVLVGAMLAQVRSFHEVVARAHRWGKTVLAGGPYVTLSPEMVQDADYLLVGEAEEALPALARDIEAGLAPRVTHAPPRPDLAQSPIPRYDLIDTSVYYSIGIQFSRGCPYSCEFCDIIEMFGRVPRTKRPQQMLAELEAILATGHRGSVFIVDDNFIGNKQATMEFLRALVAWSLSRSVPFEYYTEASLNLASEPEMARLMVQAGFTAVFIGIETPSEQALRDARKLHNLRYDMKEAVRTLNSWGLEVMGGFILGFDSDDESIFDALIDFIAQTPLPKAMVGILIAMPATQLYRRLAKEGRLTGKLTGDQFGLPNYITKLPPEVLLEGYARVLRTIYEPDAYFRRAALCVEGYPAEISAHKLDLLFALRALAGSLWYQGLTGTYRRSYWTFLGRIALKVPKYLGKAIALAIAGEHMIRYTKEDVVPRLEAAVREIRRSQEEEKRCGRAA